MTTAFGRHADGSTVTVAFESVHGSLFASGSDAGWLTTINGIQT